MMPHPEPDEKLDISPGNGNGMCSADEREA